MKKKALATFLSVCMLATVAVPTAIVSATTDTDAGDTGTSSNQPTEQKAVTVTKDESSAQFDSLEDALAAAEEGSTITLNENITVTQSAYITKGITLNGNGRSITGVGDFSSSSNPAVVLIDTDNAVVLSNLSIIGGTSNKFPLNIYTSPNVSLNNVSVTNVFTNGGAMLVNASSVTVNGNLSVSTAAGSWYGINVDSGVGVETTNPILTFAEGSKMTYTNTDDGSYNAEGPAAICVDKPIQYTNAIAGYEAAGLAAPTRNEKQQDLYYLAQAADVEVSEVTLDQTAVTLKPGETVQLHATVNPENATNKTVTFSADNQQVATVSEDGLVTAHAPGQATITAKTANGKTATCVITVENDEVVTPPSNDIIAPTPELSDETVVGDTTSVSAPVEVSQDALNNATAENPVTISVHLPTTALVQTIANSTTSNISLDVTIPDEAIHNANVKMAQIKLEKAVFEQVKASGKTFTIHVAGSDGKDLYSWTFDGSEITDTTIDVNLALTVSSSEDNQAIKEALGGNQGTVLSFAHEGNLPAKATVKVDVSASFQPGETAYFYYYNPELNVMQAMGDGYVVDENGYVEVSITHCSDYVLTKTQLNIDHDNGTNSGTNIGNDMDSPQTGDNTNLMISIAAVTAASAAITGFVVIKKRKTQD